VSYKKLFPFERLLPGQQKRRIFLGLMRLVSTLTLRDELRKSYIMNRNLESWSKIYGFVRKWTFCPPPGKGMVQLKCGKVHIIIIIIIFFLSLSSLLYIYVKRYIGLIIENTYVTFCSELANC
jgi:hypothetical protein